MPRSTQSPLTALAIGGLLVLAIVNTWQLDAIEARLAKGVPATTDSTSTQKGTDKGQAFSGAWTTQQWAKDDLVATADPANLLKPHTRPLVTGETVDRSQTLRRLLGQDPRGLNPLIANGSDTFELTRLFNNRLAYRHIEDLDVWSPELAQKVIRSADGLLYTIHLRKGVLWQRPAVDYSNPRYKWLDVDHAFTSDDYLFLFEVIKNEQVTGRVSQIRTYFEEVEEVKALDDHTFTIRFRRDLHSNMGNILDLEPAPRWLYQYDEDGKKFEDATWGQKLNEHWYNQKGIGVGPYRFVSWEPGVGIELERNDRYWGEPPSFAAVSLPIVKDSQAWVRKLKTKEVDYTAVQPEQYKTEVLDGGEPYLGETRIKRTSHPDLGYFFLGWNAARPWFADKRVRKAMTLALDRKSMIKNVFYGLGEEVSGPFAREMPCYDETIAPLPYDLAAAASLLDEAGWKDSDGDGVRDKVIDGSKVDFAFTLLQYGSSAEYDTLSSIYREALLSIGVKMTPSPVEWSTMLAKMEKREFDVYTGAWTMDWEVDLMQIWHSSEADRPASSNRISFRNPDADRIAEALRAEMDEGKRVDLCHQFHRLIAEEQPYTFIYQRTRAVLYWDYLNPLEFFLMNPYRDARYFSMREARP